jgi:O-antigen ligase
MMFSYLGWTKQQGWWVVAHVLVLGALYFEQMATPALLVFLAVLLGVMLTTQAAKPLNRVQKAWIAVAVAYAGVLIASFFIHLPVTDDGVWRLSSYAFILLLAGAFYVQTRIEITLNMVLSLLLASVTYASLVFVIELNHYGFRLLSDDMVRLGQHVSDIGGYAYLVMGSLLVMPWLIFSYFHKKRLFLILLIASMFLLLYVVLGKGRTSLLFLPIALLALVYGSARLALTRKRLWSLVALVMSMMLVVFAVSYDRIKALSQDLTLIIQHKDYNTSMGLRLVMYEVGMDIVVDHPILGVGLSHFKEEKSERVDLDVFALPQEIQKAVVSFTQIHNQFLMDSIFAGIFGLVALLFFLGYPFWRYLCYFQNSQNITDGIFAMSSMLFIGYTIFTGLFGSVFTYTYSSIFYMMINGLLLGYLSQQGFSKESKV